MKWLKKWNKFNEELKVPYYHKELTKEETYQTIKDKCTQFIDVVKTGSIDGLLFRRFIAMEYMSLGNYLLHPKNSDFVRVAPHSWNGNYHNLLVSNLPSWSKFPKRNKSLIVSGFQRSYRHSGDKDALKVVIPFDTTKIAVSSVGDFWDAFDDRIGTTNLPYWVWGKIKSKEMPSDTNWVELSAFLKEVDLFDYFDDILKPDGLFDLGYFKDITNKIERENEAWFEDECLVVNLTDIFDSTYGSYEYKPGLNKEFLDFIK